MPYAECQDTTTAYRVSRAGKARESGAPAFMKSTARYPPGPMYRTLTWWVGGMKESENQPLLENTLIF